MKTRAELPTSHIEAILLDMDGDRDNFGLRGILADALADANDPREECVRWMVANRKRAQHKNPLGEASWYSVTYSNSFEDDPESDLPIPLFAVLETLPSNGSSYPGEWTDYSSWLDAEHALHAAFARARAAGWEPEEPMPVRMTELRG